MSERIRCGWCGLLTCSRDRCDECAADPVRPWFQRGVEVPVERHDEGRPALDATAIRERYAAARAVVTGRGAEPTVEALAEELDRSPRTVRDWRRRFDLA
jgi:hypothetical protein